MSTLAPTLQAFFTDRLARQRQASPHTIAAYRDAVKLLLAFAAAADRQAPLPAGHRRPGRAADRRVPQPPGNRAAATAPGPATPGWPPSTRCSATPRCATPKHAAVIARVLAIPPKRFDKALITYLTEHEITALLAAPDQATWTGRRDHALLMLACQTGLRATELTSLTIGDVHLGTGAHVSCLGKGRKQRITPLTAATVAVLRAWLAERGGLPADPLFLTRRGTPLSRDALERRIARYTATAALTCPTLREKKVSPHVLRHSAAMRLLQRRRRHLGHRAVDGPRERRDHAGLHPRRPRPQGTGDRPDRTARHSARPLPATRHRAGLPRRTVIMPNIRSPATLTTASSCRLVGITARSA